MTTLFFSYSHQDEALRNELEKHLASLKREGLIQTWHDRRISAGSNLDSAIDNQIETAEVILLLVSSDFMASEYCYTKELGRALDRHKKGDARVIPVILRQCDWQNTPLGSLLATPTDGRPVTRFTDLDEGFTIVAKDIRAALKEIGFVGKEAIPHSLDANPTAPIANTQRSSNLRIRRKFSDVERDKFKDDAYKYILRFFQNSLEELTARYSDIEASLEMVDARHFVSTIYREGKLKAQCTITRGSKSMLGDILYADGEVISDNQCNDSYRISDDGDTLGLLGLGFGIYHEQRGEQLLTPEGVSERLWDMLLRPLKNN